MIVSKGQRKLMGVRGCYIMGNFDVSVNNMEGSHFSFFCVESSGHGQRSSSRLGIR